MFERERDAADAEANDEAIFEFVRVVRSFLLLLKEKRPTQELQHTSSTINPDHGDFQKMNGQEMRLMHRLYQHFSERVLTFGDRIQGGQRFNFPFARSGCSGFHASSLRS